MITLLNNKFTKNPRISIFNEAFMYGYGLFETLKTTNKEPEHLQQHITRLFKSAKEINLKVKYNKTQITKMAQKISAKSPHKSQRLKIIAIKDHLIITSTKLTINPKIYTEGVSLKTIQMTRSLPHLKSLAYLDSYLAHQHATQSGHYDALLINEKQEVTECAYANLFWLEGTTKNPVICTRKSDVLSGITLQNLLKSTKIPIKHKNITLKQLLKKPAIFLTQSTTGIVPISKIDQTNITPHPLTNNQSVQELLSKFQSLTMYKK